MWFFGESDQLVLGVQLAKECLILYVCWHTVNIDRVGDVCRPLSAFRSKQKPPWNLADRSAFDVLPPSGAWGSVAPSPQYSKAHERLA